MHVLFVTHGYPDRLGEEFMRAEFDALASNGLRLSFLAMRPISSRLTTSGSSAETKRQLRRPRSGSFRRLWPDAAGSPTRARAGAVLGRVHSMTQRWEESSDLRSVDHVHGLWASLAAGVAEEVAADLKVPWSFTAHRADVVAGIGLAAKVRKASFVRAATPLADSALREFRADTVRSIRIGVEISDSPRIRQTSGPINLIIPAALKPVKGHSVLLKGLKLAAERSARYIANVDFCGEGPELGRLSKEIELLGLSDIVKLRGNVPRSKLLAEYRSKLNPVVCLPSLDLGNGLHEGLPVSIVEAMANYVPVISTNTGGIPELGSDGRAVLVEAGNARTLDLEIEALALNVNRRISMAVDARKYVEKVHDCSVTSKLFVEQISGAELNQGV